MGGSKFSGFAVDICQWRSLPRDWKYLITLGFENVVDRLANREAGAFVGLLVCLSVTGSVGLVWSWLLSFWVCWSGCLFGSNGLVLFFFGFSFFFGLFYAVGLLRWQFKALQLHVKVRKKHFLELRT